MTSLTFFEYFDLLDLLDLCDLFDFFDLNHLSSFSRMEWPHDEDEFMKEYLFSKGMVDSLDSEKSEMGGLDQVSSDQGDNVKKEYY
jgi:hypothetical protein